MYFVCFRCVCCVDLVVVPCLHRRVLGFHRGCGLLVVYVHRDWCPVARTVRVRFKVVLLYEVVIAALHVFIL